MLMRRGGSACAFALVYHSKDTALIDGKERTTKKSKGRRNERTLEWNEILPVFLPNNGRGGHDSRCFKFLKESVKVERSSWLLYRLLIRSSLQAGNDA